MGRVSYDYAGETVIVTGASSGIGRAIALRFGDAGASVVCADVREAPKDPDATAPTHEAIADAGGTAEYVETDVSDPQAVRDLVSAARELGGVDVMVNNAGISRIGPFTELSVDALDELHRVNVRGAFVGCQAAAEDMLERDAGGCIVNMASVASSLAQPDMTQYEMTKGAVRMLTRGAAFNLAPDVRVNAVSPAITTTEISEGVEAVEKRVERDELVKSIPMDRPTRPEDVAAAVCFLASEDASDVTGELLRVDGGWSIF
jgi:NAD(P)-dependent dehydrogenase (short-subunit alcohol dehydrogenase family)